MITPICLCFLWYTKSSIKHQAGGKEGSQHLSSATDTMMLIQTKGEGPLFYTTCSCCVYAYTSILIIFIFIFACYTSTISSGTQGIRGHTVLCVAIGLLISITSSEAANSTEEEELSYLKLRLNTLRNRYRLLCEKYSELAASSSAPGTALSSSRLQQRDDNS